MTYIEVSAILLALGVGGIVLFYITMINGDR